MSTAVDILAEQADGAPSNDVRDVIRGYKCENSASKNRRALNNHSKDVILETINYL